MTDVELCADIEARALDRMWGGREIELVRRYRERLTRDAMRASVERHRAGSRVSVVEPTAEPSREPPPIEVGEEVVLFTAERDTALTRAALEEAFDGLVKV
jgi:hypothetical protein